MMFFQEPKLTSFLCEPDQTCFKHFVSDMQLVNMNNKLYIRLNLISKRNLKSEPTLLQETFT